MLFQLVYLSAVPGYQAQAYTGLRWTSRAWPPDMVQGFSSLYIFRSGELSTKSAAVSTTMCTAYLKQRYQSKNCANICAKCPASVSSVYIKVIQRISADVWQLLSTLLGNLRHIRNQYEIVELDQLAINLSGVAIKLALNGNGRDQHHSSNYNRLTIYIN